MFRQARPLFDDHIRVFHEHTELTKMTILALQALLREKKNSATKCYPIQV